jgi:hypothetical protein
MAFAGIMVAAVCRAWSWLPHHLETGKPLDLKDAVEVAAILLGGLVVLLKLISGHFNDDLEIELNAHTQSSSSGELASKHGDVAIVSVRLKKEHGGSLSVFEAFVRIRSDHAVESAKLLEQRFEGLTPDIVLSPGDEATFVHRLNAKEGAIVEFEIWCKRHPWSTLWYLPRWRCSTTIDKEKS